MSSSATACPPDRSRRIHRSGSWPCASVLLLLSALPGRAAWDGPPVPVPPEVRSFIEPRTVLISCDVADLNGDGLSDYLVVLEKQDGGTLRKGQRPLLVITRQRDGSLKLARRNDRIIQCATCGGAFGDPFASVEVAAKTFTVNHYGGSAWRWSSHYRFRYSRRDDTWQLVRAEEETFHTGDPEGTTTRHVYTPPKHYGKIDILDFDPEHYRGQGAR